MFRDYLRNHEDARDKYSSEKLDLVKNNPYGFQRIINLVSKYTVKKWEIINEILKKEGFNEYKFVFGLSSIEISECEKLLGKIDYKENSYRLCLYKGIDINEAAYAELDDNKLIVKK